MKTALRNLLGLSQNTEIQLNNVYGGDICQSFSFELDTGDTYFVKTQDAVLISMFHTEKKGLEALSQCPQMRLPQPIGVAQSESTALLVMTYLDLHQKTDAGQQKLGRALASMHQIKNHRFGFDEDNFIGRTPQKNKWMASWADFWIQYRMAPQIELLQKGGASSAFLKTADRFCEQLSALFATYEPAPSLLHGDLWGGNYGICRDGVPALYDPATYYGDRETDLAMTELFGGFSRGFYNAYNEVWPLDSGYAERKKIYNIYHILNHANLFGGGYTSQAQSEMQRFL